ncbi:MAG TPA: DEAD/DEAH box helicase [Candidatus Barnesiella merdigallinarum]|jgi:Superfamily II DNA helicase|nr:DEAD/DEAH box helicase [Candidatus Barnesiella merdigallinarum]
MNKQQIISIIKKHLYQQSCIVVLQGFDSSILWLLKDELLDKNILTEGGLIDLEKINSTEIMMDVMASKSPCMMTMESMIALSSSFSSLDILRKQFCLLRNNLLKMYDNPTTYDIPDFESDSFQEVKDNEIYCNYYSYCVHSGHKQQVCYIEPDFSQSTCIRKINFIEPESIANVKDQPKDSTLPILSLDNGSLQQFMEAIYFDEPLEYNAYVLPKNEILNENCGILLSAIKQSGKSIEIYWQCTPIETKQVRGELAGTLKNIWGYDSFRNLRMYENLEVNRNVKLISQGEIIETVVSEAEKALRGKSYNNVLLTSPTGAGKSILFQLSAIYLAEKYQLLTIVISPLIALMEDQVCNLQPKYSKVAALNGNKTANETTEILTKTQSGDINILYMSPELMLSHSLNSIIGDRRIGLVVVDEAHTVTTWGRDFRVDYWFLGDYLRTSKTYLKYGFPIFALTATAVWDPSRKNDMVFETIDSLNMDSCIRYIGVVRRDNIVFNIGHPEKVPDYEKQRRNRTVNGIIDAIKHNRKSIFYFPYVKHIGDILDMPELQPYRNKITQFHSQLTPVEKQTNSAFFRDGTCPIICASKAFGMGIDVPNITEVYHHAPSGCLPDYVQEIGRLARDEKLTGIAKIDFNEQDFRYTRQLHGLSTIKPYQIKAVLKKLMELYRLRGEKRNMMISPADFEYIFPNAGDQLDQRFKSCLLLISHDLMRSLQFRAIIVRAKNLFVDTYIELPKEESQRFYDDYIQYLTPLGAGTGRFILHAEKFWTDKQSNISFPLFKRKLMLQQIFKNYHVTPIVRVDISLNNNLTKTSAKLLLERFFAQSFRILDRLANPVAGAARHVKYREIRNELVDYSPIQKEEFLRSFILAFAPAVGDSERIAYCQVKVKAEEDDNQITLLRQGYEAVKSQLLVAYDQIVTNTHNQVYCKGNAVTVFLAEILNCLNIASFQKVGGADPQVFVRINNPAYLNRLVKNDNYRNQMLSDIYDKHHLSERIFTYFFLTDMTDKQRWDFIEDYFLGASEEKLHSLGK